MITKFKLFEKIEDDNILNYILDKINKDGMESLTKLEKQYLDDPENKELRKKISNRIDNIIGRKNYDPRKDTEFFNNLSDETGIGFDFTNFTDDEIEDGKYDIIWNDIEESDIEDFEEKFKIDDAKKELNGKIVYKPWRELSNETKEKFKKFIDGI